MPKKTPDLIGRRFGKLQVIKTVPITKIGWLCMCDCGNEKIIGNAHNLTSGGTTSCGCFALASRTTHGLTKSRAYVIWKGMHQRCGNPNSEGYENYGGRGIKIDPRWGRFENFLADMGHPPARFTLEREDNNGNYEPGNCRWANYKDQLNNRRSNHVIEAFGKRQSLARWCDEYAMPFNTLKNRIYRGGMTPEEALSMPRQAGYNFSPIKYADADKPQASRWKNKS
jgi:hypothetical protein